MNSVCISHSLSPWGVDSVLSLPLSHAIMLAWKGPGKTREREGFRGLDDDLIGVPNAAGIHWHPSDNRSAGWPLSPHETKPNG